MNLFVVNENPVTCAMVLDDRRVVKMTVEVAQMLSTVVRGLDVDLGAFEKDIYRATHANHPCTLWVGATRGNFEWTVAYGVALATAYRLRFGKQHKSLKTIGACAQFAANLPEGERTQFVNCTADFKDEDDVFKAYKMQLSKKWYEAWDHGRKRPKWSRAGALPAFTPKFLKDAWPAQAR